MNEKQNNNENEIVEESSSDFPMQIWKISPIAAAFIGLIGGFILYQFVGGLITIAFFGFDLENAPVNSVRLLTTAGQILFILLPALIFAKMFYSNVSDVIRVRIPEFKEFALFTVGLLILTPLLQSYLYVQNAVIEIIVKISPSFAAAKKLLDSLNELVEKTYINIISADTFAERLLVLFIIAVIPAICEEVMFRGYVQRSFEYKLKPLTSAIITALFFGVYHFNPYGILPLIGLGLFFGFAAYTSNSILIPMFLHFLNNFVAVISFFAFGNDELLSSDVSNQSDLLSAIVVLIASILVFVLYVYVIKKFYKRIDLSRRNYAGMS
ncbi:MAG: CPBP family intramembrane metalloprotease [Ignavibacteriaceae bacterium]|nr:CPBP family intramembrane metalloprotease [Ignavibacteriaceae bacterium]